MSEDFPAANPESTTSKLRFEAGMRHYEYDLTPEQAQARLAGQVYARTLSTAMEGSLAGPDYLSTATWGRQGLGATSVLAASYGQRTLTIHTAPDHQGNSIEFTYRTDLDTQLGYTVSPGDVIYVQRKGSGDLGMGQTPPVPIELDDLGVLGRAFEAGVPFPEVRNRVALQIDEIMQGS